MNSTTIRQIDVLDHIGVFGCDSSVGLSLLHEHLVPAINQEQVVLLNFAGVRNVNSSFSNALFANLFRLFGKDAAKLVRLVNVRECLKHEFASSMKMGLIPISDNVA